MFLTFAIPVAISDAIAAYINATPTGPNPKALGPSAKILFAPVQVETTASVIASAFAALLFSPKILCIALENLLYVLRLFSSLFFLSLASFSSCLSFFCFCLTSLSAICLRRFDFSCSKVISVAVICCCISASCSELAPVIANTWS